MYYYTTQVPRTVEVELFGDLVASAMVGDVVSVTGLVKVLATGEDLTRFGNAANAQPPGGGFGGRVSQRVSMLCMC